jgi:chromate transport protein ChrA
MKKLFGILSLIGLAIMYANYRIAFLLILTEPIMTFKYWNEYTTNDHWVKIIIFDVIVTLLLTVGLLYTSIILLSLSILNIIYNVSKKILQKKKN